MYDRLWLGSLTKVDDDWIWMDDRLGLGLDSSFPIWMMDWPNYIYA